MDPARGARAPGRVADHGRPAPGARRVRREVTLRRKLPLLVEPARPTTRRTRRRRRPDADGVRAVPDDRLRLIFTCCHPALAPDARSRPDPAAGLRRAHPDVARAFLVSEPTMAARITRAKKKIAQARIPYRVPSAAELPERLASVLSAVHLLFSTGHTAPTGDAARPRGALRPGARPRPHPRRAAARRGRGRAACSGCCCSPTRGAAPGRTTTGGWCCSRTRTARRWDQRAILEGLALHRRGAARPAARAVHPAGGDRRRARRWPRRSRRPTGRGSSHLYDLLLERCGRHRSSRSTGRPRWRSPTGPDAGLAELDELAADPRLAGLPLPAGRPGGPAAPARRRRRRGSMPPRSSSRPTPRSAPSWSSAWPRSAAPPAPSPRPAEDGGPLVHARLSSVTLPGVGETT